MNIIQTVGHDLHVAERAVVYTAEEIVSVGEKLIKVVEDAATLTPEFKAELSKLINDVKAIATPLAPVIASGGTNIAIDATALEPVVADVIALVKDFILFVPSLETAMTKFDTDVA